MRRHDSPPLRTTALLMLLLSSALPGSLARAQAISGPTIGGETGEPSEETVGANFLQLRWANTELLNIAIGLQQFRRDHGRFPVGDPLPQLAPRYLAPVPLIDPWGTRYSTSLAIAPESVASAGPDRRWGNGDDLVRHVETATPVPRTERSARSPRDWRGLDTRPAAPPSPEVLETSLLMERQAEALRAFHLQRGHYPVVDGVKALRAALVPEHMPAHAFRDNDGWNTPWRYRCNDVGSSYTLVSAGSDGTFESLVPLLSGPVRSAERDLVLADGSFVRWPEGLRPTAAPSPRATASKPSMTTPATPAAGRTISRNDPGELSRREATRVRLLAIKEALVTYHESEGHYPQSDDAQRLMGVLSLELTARDAWGRRLSYLSFGGGGSFALVSPGADGHLDRSLEAYTKGAKPRGGRRGDLVVVNGTLLESPH